MKREKYHEKQKWADVNYYKNSDIKKNFVSEIHETDKREAISEKQITMIEEKDVEEVRVIDVNDK